MPARVVTARPVDAAALAARRVAAAASQVAPATGQVAPAAGWADWFAGLHQAVVLARTAAEEADLADRLRRARAFIDQRFDQPIDLDDIARQACLSRYHFLRSFRRAFDVTPHQYLTQKRIERAKELLSESDLPVTEICFEVGFHSLGSFTSLFQRHVGHAPGRYRRRFVQSPGLRVSAIPACFLSVFARPR